MKNNGYDYTKFIEPGFTELEEKTEFLGELFRGRHKDEALTLCCCYIEAAGNKYYTEAYTNQENFVNIIKEFGGEEVLSAIHPIHLKDALPAKDNQIQLIIEKVEETLNNLVGQLYTDEELEELCEPHLDISEMETLKRNLWRGTLAAIVYVYIRSELVHRVGATNYHFSNLTFKGAQVAFPDFQLLYSTWGRILSSMKDYSLKTGTWFGGTFPPEWPK